MVHVAPCQSLFVPMIRKNAESAEVQPENWLVPNGDTPKSRTVSPVQYLSMENDRVSLENFESSDPQNLHLNVEAPDDYFSGYWKMHQLWPPQPLRCR